MIQGGKPHPYFPDPFDIQLSEDLDVLGFLEAVLAMAKEVYSDFKIKFSVEEMSLLRPDSSPMKNFDMISMLLSEHPEYGEGRNPLNVSVDIVLPLSAGPQVSSLGELSSDSLFRNFDYFVIFRTGEFALLLSLNDAEISSSRTRFFQMKKGE